MSATCLKNAKNVFNNDLRMLKVISVTLKVQEWATPKFCRARAVPYTLSTQIDQELDRLGEG